MQKVAIVTDSIACLPLEVIRQYDVRVVPLNIYFDGKVYMEGQDITASEAYRLLARAPDRWSTSPGSVGDYLEAYLEVGRRYSSIACVTLSSRLSTLYDVARLAGEQTAAQNPELDIRVVDSLSAAAGETLITLAAVRAAADGKDLAEVARVVRTARDKVQAVGILESIRHVYRTGRIPRIASQMLSTLNVKPLLRISGTVHITGVDMNKEHGMRRLLSTIKEKVGERPVRVAISHANVPDEGESLRDRVSTGFNCVEVLLTDFSPIMGYATGEGTLVIAFDEEDSGGQ
ncbi:DegV family protein [Chloroflexota bacterium]